MTQNQKPEELSELKRILIVGSGGRENSIAWALSKNLSIEQIYVCPGNGGTANFEKCFCLKLKSKEKDSIKTVSCNLVINCSYSGLNQITGDLTGPSAKLKHEIGAHRRKVGRITPKWVKISKNWPKMN